jgi:hypothetical protein
MLPPLIEDCTIQKRTKFAGLTAECKARIREHASILLQAKYFIDDPELSSIREPALTQDLGKPVSHGGRTSTGLMYLAQLGAGQVLPCLLKRQFCRELSAKQRDHCRPSWLPNEQR